MGIWVILLQLFGPLLVELLKKLLDKWFSKAAARIQARTGVASTFETKDSQLELIDETLEIMPRWMVARRAMLHNMREAIVAEQASPEMIASMVGWLGVAEPD